MRVTIKNLKKNFGEVSVLQGIDLQVEGQELFFLLGPSGCGKTTLLRLIAGFYQPDCGEIWFGDKPMNAVPAHRRNTGMVFQNYALWPHLTVAQNVGYGLEVRKLDRAEIIKRVGEALAIVRMELYSERLPNQLSGGQQQRVALARALVVKPDVLLLDEPLSNLDAKLRLEMRDEIRRIQAQTKITTLYVTHDQQDALALSHRIALMRDGQIEQVGPPRTLYRRPANRFVAEFMGATNWLSGQVEATNERSARIRTGFGLLLAHAARSWQKGEAVWIGFRPESVQIGPGPDNALETIIDQAVYLGQIEEYTLRVSPELTIKAYEQNPLELRRAGEPLVIHVRPEDFFVLAAG